METSLFVGGDDSNHAGETQGEIIVATFSSLQGDSKVRRHPNRRNLEGAERWMKKEGRDYRFTLLTHEGAARYAQNVPETMPLLINSYLQDHPELEVDTLKIYIDGRLTTRNKRMLRGGNSSIGAVVVDNFLKKRKNSKGRTEKRPRCPAVVWAADHYSHLLYKEEFGQLTSHDKFVPYAARAS